MLNMSWDKACSRGEKGTNIQNPYHFKYMKNLCGVNVSYDNDKHVKG